MAKQSYSRLQLLANKWRKGTLTENERKEFDAWFHAEELEPQEVAPEFGLTEEEQRERLYARISAQIHNQPVVVRRLWPRIAAAASILLILSTGGYFLLHKGNTPQTAQNQPHDFSPGKNQATLTLANGQKIVLTKGLNGKLAQQGNTAINVNAGAAIAYTPGTTETDVAYNTLSTTKGEMSPYPLVLADGTKVMLNAASSITFPTAFPGKERLVTVTGEATFLVAHDATKPFKIQVAGQTVEDIGTEFDINAYSDEPVVKVVLASGKVRIAKNGHEAFLNPGQEAITFSNNSEIKIKTADLDAAFAWRNGMFLYDNESLESIMRQIARWYDVDVVYDGADKNKLFGGGISRYKNVSQVLRKLELTGGVHFTIEGRRIIARK
ncbi:MAG TPA: FecR domain-containing protein [Mucilaginibacter sp.]|nr:FecR domain-containing protein [Mucilaginibacter sp.]